MARPFEAKDMPELPPSIDDQMRELLVAVNGSVYHGERMMAIIETVRWLRAKPDEAAKLLDLYTWDQVEDSRQESWDSGFDAGSEPDYHD